MFLPDGPDSALLIPWCKFLLAYWVRDPSILLKLSLTPPLANWLPNRNSLPLQGHSISWVVLFLPVANRGFSISCFNYFNRPACIFFSLSLCSFYSWSLKYHLYYDNPIHSSRPRLSDVSHDLDDSDLGSQSTPAESWFSMYSGLLGGLFLHIS